MGISFSVAAEASQVGEDEDVVDVPIEGIVYQARRPTTAQVALMISSRDLNVAFNLVEGILGEVCRAHIERLVWARRIDLDDIIGNDGSEQNPEGGLISQIIQEFNKDRPTQPSTDSSSSPTAGGRRSTGRSRGKTSTPSTSPSTDSSTS